MKEKVKQKGKEILTSCAVWVLILSASPWRQVASVMHGAVFRSSVLGFAHLRGRYIRENFKPPQNSLFLLFLPNCLSISCKVWREVLLLSFTSIQNWRVSSMGLIWSHMNPNYFMFLGPGKVIHSFFPWVLAPAWSWLALLQVMYCDGSVWWGMGNVCWVLRRLSSAESILGEAGETAV